MKLLRRTNNKALRRALSCPATPELTCHLVDGYVVWTDPRGVMTVVRADSVDDLNTVHSKENR